MASGTDDQLRQARASLLYLPAELRLIILRHLLTAKQAIVDEPQIVGKCLHKAGMRPRSVPPLTSQDRLCEWLGLACRHDYQSRVFSDLHPAILATCRQMYSEGRPLLYTENTIRITLFCEMLKITSDPRAIGRLTIRVGGEGSVSTLLEK